MEGCEKPEVQGIDVGTTLHVTCTTHVATLPTDIQDMWHVKHM